MDGAVAEYAVPSVALTESGFATVIRFIKRGRMAPVEQFKVTVDQNMKRLRLRSKKTAPADMPPDELGSSQTNVGSLAAWAGSIQKRDAEAKAQLLVISATLRARLA